MIVFPFFEASLSRVKQILLALKLSKPLVGSSSKITDGSVINSTAIAVSLRSPNEIVFLATEPIIVFLH